jgi:hypothetical protein
VAFCFDRCSVFNTPRLWRFCMQRGKFTKCRDAMHGAYCLLILRILVCGMWPRSEDSQCHGAMIVHQPMCNVDPNIFIPYANDQRPSVEKDSVYCSTNVRRR